MFLLKKYINMLFESNRFINFPVEDINAKEMSKNFNNHNKFFDRYII